MTALPSIATCRLTDQIFELVIADLRRDQRLRLTTQDLEWDLRDARRAVDWKITDFVNAACRDL